MNADLNLYTSGGLTFILKKYPSVYLAIFLSLKATLSSITATFTLFWLVCKVLMLSRVWLFVTPWTVAHQAPLSVGFSRQEYWSGWSLSSPGDLSDSGIKPRSPALQADCWLAERPGSIYIFLVSVLASYCCWDKGASQVAVVIKNPPANAGDLRDLGSIPGLGRCPGGGDGNPFLFLAWRIPWMAEPGGFQSTGSRRVGHGCSDLAHTLWQSAIHLVTKTNTDSFL